MIMIIMKNQMKTAKV